MADLVRQTQLDRDKAALVDPQSARQVMDIGDRAQRLHKALKGMKGYEDEYYKAFEVMIEAYRIVGVELAAMDRRKSGGDYTSEHGSPTVPSLADLGITKKQSSEWQSIALVPLTDIEEYIKARRGESEQVTKTDILRIAENYKSAEQKTFEQSALVLNAGNLFLAQVLELVSHIQKYPDTRSSVSKDLVIRLEAWVAGLDKLQRSIL